MYTKEDLKDAFDGVNPVTKQDLPIKLVQLVVEQMKMFLLGDGYQKKIKFLAINPQEQADLNDKIAEVNLYRILNDIYTDVLVYGEGYLDLTDGKLRHIKSSDIIEVKVDPEDPLKVVYLREWREVYQPSSNSYNKVEVKHFLQLPPSNQLSDELDLLNLPTYQYYKQVQGETTTLEGEYIPVVRIVNDLQGRVAKSPIERIIHTQLEYNEIRSRINLNGKHHKPIMYTVGTSAPKFISRTNAASPEIDTKTGSVAFNTAFTSADPVIFHFPINDKAAEYGIEPKIGYIQPIDTPYLERQRLIVLQDIYSLTGVMVLELQNARSASSSSSLSILYEPLLKATLSRASYLLPVIQTIFNELGLDTSYRVELPDMLPKNLEDKRLQIEAVKSKLISRKRYLVEVEGLTEQEALRELEQLDNEKGLNIQYSAALVDSKDTPNLDSKSLFEESVIN
jgi:hypothetical protein